MGFVSTTSTQFFPQMFTTSSLKTKLPSQFISISSSDHIPHPSPSLKPIHKKLLHKTHASFDFQSPLPDKALVQRNFLSRKGESLVVTFGTKNGSGNEDNRALETVLKLYTAMKERNVLELSDVIADECRCVSNFFSYFHPFHGKKQVLEFLSFLMGYMGKRIEFVVYPTLHDGMNVGVSWRLVWDKTHIPFGKGFGFYMCHMYQGKMEIRNIEMFMEPLLHIEPLRLKVLGFVMPILDKIGWSIKDMPTLDNIRSNIKEKRAMYTVLTLVIMVLFLFMINLS
ncbi:hypothetical protein BVC80_1785g25 [Macleaya cordata]|uniref:SnoaL-like domain n=1 Tax=Macleaya cordata TaxID=56857 RepID=A0A200QFI1_MACCD|nr:hypothetical protein BVC80_1785g25 [Macleaya cordata]